jgi:hypothetical protein
MIGDRRRERWGGPGSGDRWAGALGKARMGGGGGAGLNGIAIFGASWAPFVVGRDTWIQMPTNANLGRSLSQKIILNCFEPGASMVVSGRVGRF